MQRTASERYRETVFEELKELEEQRTKVCGAGACTKEAHADQVGR